MGQTVGYMPDTWDGLLEEKDRVLHWSGEVLSKVADNINQEDSLLIEYGNKSIDEKIDSWIKSNEERIDRFFSEHQYLSKTYKPETSSKLAEIRELLILKMRRDYRRSYKDMRKFTKKVDKLGERQRKIHEKLQDLEGKCDGDVEKFRTKFGPLRVKTFKYLRIGEKMMFEDERLKKQFVKRVCAIDLERMAECTKHVDKWMRMLEKITTIQL